MPAGTVWQIIDRIAACVLRLSGPTLVDNFTADLQLEEQNRNRKKKSLSGSWNAGYGVDVDMEKVRRLVRSASRTAMRSIDWKAPSDPDRWVWLGSTVLPL